jgi:N-acetylmuramoyl-L-alanine amidase
MNRLRSGILPLLLAAPLLGGGTAGSGPPGAAAAAAGTAATAPNPVTITSIRSWASPTGTRVVMDFTATVAYVAPDSGDSRTVLVSVPDPVVRANDVPETLRVADGLVDSVTIAAAPTGTRFAVWFHDSAHFRVFDLPAQEDQPYRLVVDVVKPGAATAEGRRLEGIASLKKKDKIRIVAVDAGHGGEDTGARSARSVHLLEKDVTLAVARALVDELNRIPGIRGVLTRDGDYFVPLRERYHLAEKVKADLFVSIHANSTRRRNSGNGTEVYFLSLRGAGDQADADLADSENAADLVGGVPPQTGDELVNILYDVKRSSALQQSQLLAETVLDHVAADRRLESRGVKQAGFVVLKSVEFPSILVETAFINNITEARLLKRKDFQLNIAKQIAAGVKEYFKRAGIELVGEKEAKVGNRLGG